MSLRYLHKTPPTHSPKETKSATKTRDQTDEAKRTPSKPESKRFTHAPQSTEETNWTQLNNLNEKAHDSTQKKRNFKGIINYFKDISPLVTTNVAKFFEGLPNVNEFIQLNLLFYKDQKSVDVEVEKIKTYEDAYISVFEQK